MRWTFAGRWILVLVCLSVAHCSSLHVVQRPRFYGVKAGMRVFMYCVSFEPLQPRAVEWLKAPKYDAPRKDMTRVEESAKFKFHNQSALQHSILLILDVQPEDSGVYFCDVNGTLGSGTALQATEPVDLKEAVYRSKLKDGLMVLQGLLLAACVAALLLRKRTLGEKNDSLYEEPETDHIYEGLAIESCEGGLYEDLSVYAQPEDTEAPWE